MYSVDVFKAEQFARKVHAGQTDKAGKPYAGHLERVAAGVDSDRARVVAWLHDAVEDHRADGVTFDVIAERFGQGTADAVRCLTKEDGETYDEYIARVGTNPLARAVKVSDLIDNSNLSRLPYITMADISRQAKYNRSLRLLTTCCTFLEEDPKAAGEGLSAAGVKGHGDDQHLWDEGGRYLMRCRKCGCLMLHQWCEFHNFSGGDDGLYGDYMPVASMEEADRILERFGPMEFEKAATGRVLRYNNGKWCWYDPEPRG